MDAQELNTQRIEHIFKILDEIKALQNTNNTNKSTVKKLLFYALVFSFVLVFWGICKMESATLSHESTVTKDSLYMHHICGVAKTNTIKADTIVCYGPFVTKDQPVVTTDKVYSNISCVLMYISILVFISLALWGAFTSLFKILKYEHEMNSKLLDVQKDIYKETQMWELTKEKKEYENNNQTNDSSKKDKEIQRRIQEFEKIEKVKLELKYKHELELKEKEIQITNKTLSEQKE